MCHNTTPADVERLKELARRQAREMLEKEVPDEDD